jgi:heterodisulfide reductase subunit A
MIDPLDNTQESPQNSVVVVGAGIAGIQASLDLAELGVNVHLIEETPSIGGRMPQLDKTFPTNDCSICILAPKMNECARHPHITVHICSSLRSVSGEPGNFLCEVVEHATYIDPEKCVACGMCEQKCPVKVPDLFDRGLRQRKAIYRYFVQGIPSTYVIDAEHCLYQTRGVCRLCEKVCPAQAVKFDDEDRILSIRCAAIIIAAGIDPYDPSVHAQYGYPTMPNVVTSIEFERMLSASGPLGGHLVRPSDNSPPKKIAFIQCVGSRDPHIKHDYCSSVCCMYAMKEAIIAKEHLKDLEASFFFMDVRASGKEFDKYYERAKSQFHLRFVRSKVGRISQLDGGDLRLHFTREDGKRETEDFSMVVLSVGIQPREETHRLSDRLDIAENDEGFLRTDTFHPLDTDQPGIYVCGAASEPRDIPQSVMSASGAVARCATLMALKRQERAFQKDFPPERDITVGDRPRVGVFICHCGINIAGVVDVARVVDAARDLPSVEFAGDLLYACSQDGLNTIKEKIGEHDLNRVVVAACTPRTHEPLFQETLREAGLNPYLFEMANIRDQCSWPHMNEPELATQKAGDLVSMGVAKAEHLVSLRTLTIAIDSRALVIGGGLSGMTAALTLADAGYEVFLVEREAELGGNLRAIYRTLEGDDPRELLRTVSGKVRNHPRITLFLRSAVEEISGYVGNFRTSLVIDQGDRTDIEHGVVIVATGAIEHRTSEYLRGKSTRVITQLELEAALNDGHLGFPHVKSVVMIQCVGSREGERMFCGRVCCGQAVKNSLALKAEHPYMDIYVLYRDMRTFGYRETFFREAREAGVVFMRYDLDRKPTVELIDPEDPGSRLQVMTTDPILGSEVILEADLVVLSVSIDPDPGNKDLAQSLKVPLNKEGFFLEAHMKLRPVDFATDGVFMCGLAHGPKYIGESIVQAKAAAARALTVLSKKMKEGEGTVCWVDSTRCSGCGTCQEICSYAAAEVDPEEGVAKINEALCKGCGVCAASCRSGAIDLKGFSKQQLISALSPQG